MILGRTSSYMRQREKKALYDGFEAQTGALKNINTELTLSFGQSRPGDYCCHLLQMYKRLHSEK